ncbi:MAG: DUF3313 domain-containing protein [Chitinophagaceae bacterium]|nr:DUF3313 domain-containing protein [Rubrivivax sp.]
MLAALAANAQTKPAESGFLKDYSQLAAAKDREGIWMFVDKSTDYRSFTKVMFDPVEVILAPNPDYKGVQPDALKRMTDNMLASFTKALQPDYTVVASPGPDVLRVRLALTGVQPAKPPTSVTDFIPIKAVFNVARAAAGAAPTVAEMSAEMEVLDPQGKRVAAATATRKGDKTLKQGEAIQWSDLQATSDYWAKGFRQRLDEVRGIAGR